MVSDPEEGGFLLVNQEQLNLAWVLLKQQTVKENCIDNYISGNEQKFEINI